MFSNTRYVFDISFKVIRYKDISFKVIAPILKFLPYQLFSNQNCIFLEENDPLFLFIK